MTSDAVFNILYDGPALESSEMDVRQLAPALHAVGDVLDAANKVLNGSEVKLSVKVKGSFKSGCFGIDFSLTQGLWTDFVGLFSSKEITAISSAVSILAFIGFTAKDSVCGLIKVIAWLRNRKISKVIELDGGKVEIYVDDEHITTEKAVLKLLEDYSVRKSLSAVIYDPLENEGIDKFAAGTESGGLVVIDKSNYIYFASPAIQDQLIHETVYETILQVSSISFNEDNKWRLSEGTGSFHAEIADADFMAKVQKNEVAFAKDDLLTVRMRRRQWITEKGTVKPEYIVEKVLDHKSAAVQLKLDIY
jgi:hypothetical protein